MNIYEARFDPNGDDMTLAFNVAAHNTYRYGFTTRKHGQSFEPGETGGYVAPDDNLDDAFAIALDGMDGGTILIGFMVYGTAGVAGQLSVPVDVRQGHVLVARIDHVVAPEQAGDYGSFVIRTAAH
jgi:hypothetical protein